MEELVTQRSDCCRVQPEQATEVVDTDTPSRSGVGPSLVDRGSEYLIDLPLDAVLSSGIPSSGSSPINSGCPSRRHFTELGNPPAVSHDERAPKPIAPRPSA